MAIWEAEIIDRTNLDPNTRTHEVSFHILDKEGKPVEIDGQIITLRATGNPTNIKDNVAQEASKFLLELQQSDNLKVGDKVEFEI